MANAERKTRTRKTITPRQAELKAMASVTKTLDSLDHGARERVQAWIAEQYRAKDYPSGLKSAEGRALDLRSGSAIALTAVDE
jgi:hypothetical protein